MRISDWSSDVCSSDLWAGVFVGKGRRLPGLSRQLEVDLQHAATLERDPAAKAQQAACGIERRGGRRRLRASRLGRKIGRGGKMAQFVAQALGALPVVADVGEQALGALVVQLDAREVGSLKVDRKSTRLNSSH